MKQDFDKFQTCLSFYTHTDTPDSTVSSDIGLTNSLVTSNMGMWKWKGVI